MVSQQHIQFDQVEHQVYCTNMEQDGFVATAVEIFRDQFGTNPTVAAFSPGRVNLIGEHTDYNDGFVLPFALPYRTIIVGAEANSNECTVISSYKGLTRTTFVLNDKLTKGEPEWANYVKGPAFQYLKELPFGAAFNAVVVSNVPIGSGLSSSAALEVAMCTFIEQLYKIRSVTTVDKALRAQKAEHTFAGMPCGIMDQYISAMGKAGNLLLIDCRTHGYTLVPYDTNTDCPVILVTNSNVKHQLTGSEYPDRVKQCKEAVRILQETNPNVKALRDVTLDMLEGASTQMSDLVYRRARHVVGEDIRTLAAVQALEDHDFKKVGELMTLSHRSLQHDYEVSCPELDFLVDTALKVPGVYGSRMTGGGFGGCTVTLVQRHAVNTLKTTLTQAYREKLKFSCDCYECLPEEGTGAIDLGPYLSTGTNRDETAASNGTEENTCMWSQYSNVLALSAVVVGVAIGTMFILQKMKK